MSRFATHFHRPPDQLNQAHLREYPHHSLSWLCNDPGHGERGLRFPDRWRSAAGPGGGMLTRLLNLLGWKPDAILVVSYSRADQMQVRALVKLLRAGLVGIERAVFWDEDFEPGEPWFQQMEARIDAAKQLFVFWCSHSATSTQVRREVDYALSRKKRTVPVLLDDTPLSERLATVHGIDLRDAISHPETPEDRQRMFGPIPYSQERTRASTAKPLDDFVQGERRRELDRLSPGTRYMRIGRPYEGDVRRHANLLELFARQMRGVSVRPPASGL